MLVSDENITAVQAPLLVSEDNKPVGQASLLVNSEDKIIEHGQSGMIDLPSPNPVLLFFISRCRKLQEQKEAGLLKDGGKVFEFMDK